MTFPRMTNDQWLELALDQNARTSLGSPDAMATAHLLAGILAEEQSRMSHNNKAVVFALLRLELAKFAKETEHLFTVQKGE